jgi:hypothetical protein
MIALKHNYSIFYWTLRKNFLSSIEDTTAQDSLVGLSISTTLKRIFHVLGNYPCKLSCHKMYNDFKSVSLLVQVSLSHLLSSLSSEGTATQHIPDQERRSLALQISSEGLQSTTRSCGLSTIFSQ